MSSVCPHGNYEGDDEACGRCAAEERRRADRLENFVRDLAENGLSGHKVDYHITMSESYLVDDFSTWLKETAKAALEGK